MRRGLTWLALLVGVLSAARVAGQTPPNIVLIVADDLGWADLSCYALSLWQTPNLDRLAREGLRFTDAYAASCVCSPTRAALMTGRHPARLHLTTFLPGRKDMPTQRLLQPVIRQALPREETTLAELLKARGYACGHYGKWHLGEGPDSNPLAQGFDIYRGAVGRYFQFKGPNLVARDEQDYLTDRLTEEAELFLEANRNRPFFLYLPHFAVHIPLQAKPDLLAVYEKKAAQVGADLERKNPHYAAVLHSLDESVGRILKKLDALGLGERTLVVFTSDNGGLSVIEGPNTPATSNAPLRLGKGYLYEGGIRVPLLIRWPSVVAPGKTSSVPVRSEDLFMTLVQAAGAQLPADREYDGVSLLALLKGEADGLRRDFLYWHFPHYSNQGGKPSGAIRFGNWKLIEHYEDGQVELYHLEQDVGERHNLAAQHPEVRDKLQRELASWRQRIRAQMPLSRER
ncbi:MAG: sulfatase [Gemmatales bacterium]|nr:sulfatase [Gemmatales bacterium]MCS7159552.1 sulfatase [Gemmatales bacterium]MDW8174750.1 sulfatase [Gemmatales bacterium]MDW8222129.1 sulfatase [Gemmatales bacterium]